MTKKYTDEFLISELNRYYMQFQKVPTTTDFDNAKGYPSTTACKSHFKTWNEALQAAGLICNKVYKYSDEFLISELHRFYELYGHVPTRDEMNSDPDFPSAIHS